MSCEEYTCTHLNQIIDEREGTYVCTDCGLVLENFYLPERSNLSEKYHNKKSEVKEILSKLNLPESFTSHILNEYDKSDIKVSKKQLLPYIVYSTLNDLNVPISIKDINAVSGFNDSKIYEMQHNKSIILRPEEILEKYCKLLDFDYKTYSLIKVDLPKKNTGHNPLTIIASTIYAYCKKRKLKYSMKTIAKTCNTSCISIQRYLKSKTLTLT